MEIHNIIKNVARDFMAASHQYVDNDGIIEKCIYCMLTVENNNVLKALQSLTVQNYPQSLQKLILKALNTKNSPKVLPLVTKLTLDEIPKYRSDILSSLSSFDALSLYFLPKFENCTSFELLIVCIMLLTFQMRVIGKYPMHTNWASLMKELSKHISDNSTPELLLMYIDFLDSSVNFIDVEDAFMLGIQFQYPLLRECKNIFNRLDEEKLEQISFYSDPMPFEKVFTIGFRQSLLGIRNPSDPDFNSYILILLNLLQICVNITAQKTIGRALSLYLTNYPNENTFYNQISKLRIPECRYTRRYKGILGAFGANIMKWNELENSMHANSRFISLGPYGDPQFQKITGLDSPYIDIQYIKDLLSANLFIPRVVISYIDFATYAITAFILFKETTALDIWEDIRLSLLNDPLAAGKIEKCYVQQGKTDLEVNTTLDVDDKFVLLINFDGESVDDIAYAQIKTTGFLGSGKFKYFCKNISSTNNKFTHIYSFDPAKVTYLNTLENAMSLLMDGNKIEETVLSKIWIGTENFSEIGRLQSNMNSYMIPDIINFGGALTPEKFMQVMLDVRNVFGKSTSFRCGQDISNAVYAKIPINSKEVKLEYQNYPLKCVDDDIKLTREQQLSVISSLFFPFTLVQGPPGTGKTATMLAITRVLAANLGITGYYGINVRAQSKTGLMHPLVDDWDNMDQFDSNGQNSTKILICAHSNNALDQMLVELANSGLDIFRFGRNPTNEGLPLTIEGRIIKKVRRALELLDNNDISIEDDYLGPIYDFLQALTTIKTDGLFDYIRNYNVDEYEELIENYIDGMSPSHSVIQDLNEIRKIIDFILIPRNKLVKYYLNRIGIIGCTISYATIKIANLAEYNIRTVIIEEAAKIIETEMISFLMLNPTRFILIGDQAQLAPVVKCDDVRLQGRFDMSFFERLLNSGIAAIQLTYQGRAKTEIANLYRNNYFRPLKDLKSVKSLQTINCLDYSLQWINVPIKAGGTMQNDNEAKCILYTLKLLKNNGIDLNLVSIITPYKNQKFNLKRFIDNSGFAPRDICTVDEFQGLQNIIVILSLVSNIPSVWLRDSRRINVSCSRSRSAFLIFGNMEGYKSTLEWEPVVKTCSNVCGEAGFLYSKGKKITYDMMQ